MKYFSIERPIFIVPSQKCNDEFEKIDKFMNLLENSGVGKIIESVKLKNNNCQGLSLIHILAKNFSGLANVSMLCLSCKISKSSTVKMCIRDSINIA